MTWHATEFGRRTACQRFRVVHTDKGWQLMDAEWRPLGQATRKIVEAQQLAERFAQTEDSHGTR